MADLPEVASKLNAPSKKSQFERQRAEAEAKKAREKAETAAVLKEFEASFEDEEDRNVFQTNARVSTAPGKRHFTSTTLKSGPGSLSRSGPGSLGSVFNKKRPFDDYAEKRERGSAFSYHENRRSSAREEEDQEDDKAAAKPTLHLASMPPGTSPTIIKGLFAHTPLNVENVRILPPPSYSGPVTERKSTSAIVTLATETPATDIDTVVSHLQQKYLGFGFKLSISRHLSSSAIGNATILSSASNSLPFGAKTITLTASLSRAPPPNQRYAPPPSYTSSTPYSRGPQSQVIVQSPTDLKQLKLIHKTLEALLTYGPEFEALLMSRPEIQRDEKWSWLWDSASVGGVYYRWRLWEILTNATKRRKRHSSMPEMLFDGQSSWQPAEPLRFEYTTQINEFVSDEDYNSSDEEEDEDVGRGDLARRHNDHNASGLSGIDDIANDGMGYLNPLAKSKLTHLLTRLPESTSKLRRGDVARITAFAIEHAGAGGDEVAELITRNVVRPFCKLEETDDSTSASMVGLYVISDILSSSASAGVRHAWRYRTLFEHALRQQRVFDKLGRAEKDFKWGKLKGEKWKRSVQNLLSLWEGWSVFPQAAQEAFTEVFLTPPLTDEEKRAAEAAEAEAQQRASHDAQKTKVANRWKTVEDEPGQDVNMEDLDGTPMSNDDDDDDDDMMIMATSLENIDGVSMVDSSDEEAGEAPSLSFSRPADEKFERVDANTGETQEVRGEVEETPPRPAASVNVSVITLSGPPGKKQRPRAADMFAGD